MSLAKFSAKQMSKRLKAKKKEVAIQKAEEERKRKLKEIELKKLAEKKEQERLELERTQRYIEKQEKIALKNLMIRCLNNAIDGKKSIQIDDHSTYLALKGFSFTEEVIENEPIINLDRALKKLKTKELEALKAKLKLILESLKGLNNDFANRKINRILQGKNTFLYCEKALLFLNNYLYDSFENAFLEIEEEDDYDFDRRTLLMDRVSSYSSFIRNFIPAPVFDEDNLRIYTLSWNKKAKVTINDNWLNASNLNWISSVDGKVFFDEFFSLINLKTEALSSSLLFDVEEKLKTTFLKFENNVSLNTPISIDHFLEIIELLGYKKRLPRVGKDGLMKGVKIIWADQP
jgi:hypothetical protein